MEALTGPAAPWGRWMRHQCARFDFSSVKEPGLYVLEYADALADRCLETAAQAWKEEQGREPKEDWSFLWFENEYVVGTGTSFMLAAAAADALAR